MEDYLTHVRSGTARDRAPIRLERRARPGFLARMTNDCLRFTPTIATTCYAMTITKYSSYEDRIGKTYEQNSVRS